MQLENLVVTVEMPLYCRAQGYKTFFMLNSTEHEILNSHKYTNIKKFSFFKLRYAENAIFPAHKC